MPCTCPMGLRVLGEHSIACDQARRGVHAREDRTARETRGRPGENEGAGEGKRGGR